MGSKAKSRKAAKKPDQRHATAFSTQGKGLSKREIHGTVEITKASPQELFAAPKAENCDAMLLAKLITADASVAKAFMHEKIVSRLESLADASRDSLYSKLQRLYDLETVLLAADESTRGRLLGYLDINPNARKIGLELLKKFVRVPDVSEVGEEARKKVQTRLSLYYQAFIGARMSGVGPKSLAEFLSNHGGVEGAADLPQRARREQREAKRAEQEGNVADQGKAASPYQDLLQAAPFPVARAIETLRVSARECREVRVAPDLRLSFGRRKERSMLSLVDRSDGSPEIFEAMLRPRAFAGDDEALMKAISRVFYSDEKAAAALEVVAEITAAKQAAQDA